MCMRYDYLGVGRLGGRWSAQCIAKPLGEPEPTVIQHSLCHIPTTICMLCDMSKRRIRRGRWEGCSTTAVCLSILAFLEPQQHLLQYQGGGERPLVHGAPGLVE